MAGVASSSRVDGGKCAGVQIQTSVGRYGPTWPRCVINSAYALAPRLHCTSTLNSEGDSFSCFAIKC